MAAALLLKRPDQPLLTAAAALFDRPDLAGEDLAASQTDFADIFFSPASGRFLPPFEGAFRQGRLLGRACREAGQAYERAGFEYTTLDADPLWKPVLAPDHLGVELAFMSALLANHRSAPEEGFLESAAGFHARHLAPWTAVYGEKLARTAYSALYRAAGDLLVRLAHWRATDGGS